MFHFDLRSIGPYCYTKALLLKKRSSSWEADTEGGTIPNLLFNSHIDLKEDTQTLGHRIHTF
jgi:hypothetical protein